MADKYVTVAGAGTKAGTSWANAFSVTEFIVDADLSAVAGDTYWIEEGTYTFDSLLSTAIDGNSTNLISMIGVKSGTTAEPPTASDYADTTARPLFDLGASYPITVDNYWLFKGLRMTCSSTFTLKGDASTQLINCYFENSKAGGPTYCVNVNGTGTVFDCEGNISNGTAGTVFVCAGTCVVSNNYARGGAIGFTIGNNISAIVGNITTSPIGISMGGADECLVSHNTLYGCTTGISGTTSAGNVIINNTISNCTDGINFTTTSFQIMVDYNNYYNNTTDVTGITKGPNALAVDPQFTAAGSGDFSLGSGSALIGAGFGMRLGIG